MARTALESAASIAALVLTPESLVTDTREPPAPAAPLERSPIRHASVATLGPEGRPRAPPPVCAPPPNHDRRVRLI